jgi:DNA-binding NtrC family response regulator
MAGKSKKVLLVEDDLPSLFAVRSILQDQGHEIAAFTSAEDARNRNGERVDVAIIDVRLPGESGTELAKKLIRKIPNIKIILVTAYNGIEDIRAAVPGATVLMKPLDMAKIASLLL